MHYLIEHPIDPCILPFRELETYQFIVCFETNKLSINCVTTTSLKDPLPSLTALKQLHGDYVHNVPRNSVNRFIAFNTTTFLDK